MQNNTHTTSFSTLQYVDAQAPVVGHYVAITDDVLWCRMPLPFSLDHINVYLLRDTGYTLHNGDIASSNHWAMIDTGIHSRTTLQAWDQILASIGGQLSRVIATHMHPDHIGCAGTLTEQHRVPLYMSQTEYFAARALFAGNNGADNWQDRAYFRRAGLDEAQVQKATQGDGGFSRIVSALPLSFERMAAGDDLRIGNNTWHCIEGQGHCPEHISLYCEAAQILLAGDQVLPQITPNIGAYSTQPNSNPLQRYLTSLSNFEQCAPNTLVLPSHRQPFRGLHARIAQLQQHHLSHIEQLTHLCQTPQTVVSVLPHMFKRELDEHGMFFAIAEAYAHLNYMVDSGILTRLLRDSVYQYITIRG